MREHRTACSFVATVEELNVLLNKGSIEITYIRPIGNDMAVTFHRSVSQDVIPMSNNTNIYIASATTAWARLELYKYLDMCSTESSSTVVYCDTDSIFYEGSHVPTGSHLGELTNELKDGDVIEKFVSGGPKNYAYVTRRGERCVKAKGFSLNHINKQVFSIDGLSALIEYFVCAYGDSEEGRVILPPYSEWKKEKNVDRELLFKAHNETPGQSSAFIRREKGISVYNAHRIQRTRLWDLLVKQEQKFFSIYFDKRVVLLNYETLPYGYKD